MQTYIVVAIIAYLLGSIPFGYILVRLFRKQDVRTMGSGNIGATNVARSGAKGLGIATLILDAAKGYAAVYLVNSFLPLGFVGTETLYQQRIHEMHITYGLAAIFAILGHMFPVWLRFRGGKGVATGVGVFLALAPIAVGIVLLLFVVVVWFSRYVSLGSIIATAAFPLIALLLERFLHPRRTIFMSPIMFGSMCIAAFLIIVRHKDNIRRLLAGTEHRLGEKKSSEVRA